MAPSRQQQAPGYSAGTLAKHSDGALYLLVTDQGYLREPGVVWERLSGIDGDTQFFTVGSGFRILGSHPSIEPVRRACFLSVSERAACCAVLEPCHAAGCGLRASAVGAA
jgi:hypothetical protein